MDIVTDDLEVIDNPAAGRFEIRAGHEVAFLMYARGDGAIAYTHTEVPPVLEGHGIAAKLTVYALDYARANGLEVVPLCPYVAEYIERHPAYRDLVAPRPRWREFLRR